MSKALSIVLHPEGSVSHQVHQALKRAWHSPEMPTIVIKVADYGQSVEVALGVLKWLGFEIGVGGTPGQVVVEVGDE